MLNGRINMTLKLYTIQGCPACAKARKYLDEHGVNYKEIDVNDHLAEVRKIVHGDKVQIPILCNKGKCEIGFSARSFEEIIKG